MPKGRLSSSSGKTHAGRSRSQSQLKPHRFIGVDLSGGKNNRTCVAILEYYPTQNKLFLTHIYEQIQQEENLSADQILYEIIRENSKGLEYLCVDAPLNLPKCIRCRLVCPGYERCKEKEIQWMWRQHRKHKKSRPRAKLFTPYTQRAAEIFISTEIEDDLHPMETLGANIAPLAARAHFLKRRLPKIRTIEVYPPLSVLRIGHGLRVAKSHLLHYKHKIGGDESRQIILNNLVRRDLVFIYQQDFMKLIDNEDSFDAFISALTGYFKYTGQCEKPARDFPLSDGWIDFPVKNLEL